MNRSRIPSPARSQGPPVTPRRYKSRSTRSVGSPARSNTSGRLSSIIDQFREKNRDSFAPSPLNKSVLTDNTDIEQPRRNSWWKKVDHSRDIMEVLDNNPAEEVNVLDELDIEVLSQEKREYTMDILESSGSESIQSIVIPQRKLFPQKENQPQNKFNQVQCARESFNKHNKTNIDPEKPENVGPRVLFNRVPKRSKPVFPADLLKMSPDKTIGNKTTESVKEVKTQHRNLFGNRPGTKRKNMFADFVVSESEEEISEIQPRIFAFQKNLEPVRHSTSRHVREASPSSSLTTEMEMDDWKLLPSSTMVEHQLDAMEVKTPGKKRRLTHVSETKESEGTGSNLTVNKTKQSNRSLTKNKSKTSINISDNREPKNKSVSSKNKSKTTTDEEQALTNIKKQNNIQGENKIKDIEVEVNTEIGVDANDDDVINVENKTQNANKNETSKNMTIDKDQEALDAVALTENCEDDVADKTLTEANQENDDEDFTLTYDDDEEPEIADADETIDKNHKSNEGENEKSNEKGASNTTEHNNIDMSGENQDINTQLKETSQRELNKLVDSTKEEIGKLQSIHEDNEAKETSTQKLGISDTNAGKSDQEEMEIGNQQEELAVIDQHEAMEVENHEEKQANNQNEEKIAETNEVERETNQDKLKANENQEKTDNKTEEINITPQEQKTIEVIEKEEPCNELAEEVAEEDNNDAELDNELSINQDQNESLDIVEEEHEEEDQIEEEEIEQDNDDSEVDNDISDKEAENESNEIEENEDEEQEVINNDDSDVEQEVSDDDPQDESEEIDEQNQDEEIQNESEDVEGNEENENLSEEQLEDDEEIHNESEVVEDHEGHGNSSQEQLEDDEEIENHGTDVIEESQEIRDDDEVDDNEIENQEEQGMEEQQESEMRVESPNLTHDTTGRNRKKEELKSPEVPLHDTSNQHDSFMAQGRNTSIRRTKSVLKALSIRPSMAPPRESTGFSDGTKNSSAEGSGWDSHRTTRKTLRQTFGKDFTPRKSLRALVMEKSAKRQTAINEANAALQLPQANSTELPINDPQDEEMDYEDNIEMVEESEHEVSKRTRQTTLEMYLQKIKEENIERNIRIEQQVKNSLKFNTVRTEFLVRAPYKPTIRRTTIKPQGKPAKRTKPCLIALEDLPPELMEDMKYKPPKRFRASNAPWITKRLYKFLESKLEPKYDYKARVRAEKLVEMIYNFVRDSRRLRIAPTHAVAELKRELARLDIVQTHFQFYNFIGEFLPAEVKVKVVPDIVNDIPVPRNIHAEILTEVVAGH